MLSTFSIYLSTSYHILTPIAHFLQITLFSYNSYHKPQLTDNLIVIVQSAQWNDPVFVQVYFCPDFWHSIAPSAKPMILYPHFTSSLYSMKAFSCLAACRAVAVCRAVCRAVCLSVYDIMVCNAMIDCFSKHHFFAPYNRSNSFFKTRFFCADFQSCLEMPIFPYFMRFSGTFFMPKIEDQSGDFFAFLPMEWKKGKFQSENRRKK